MQLLDVKTAKDELIFITVKTMGEHISDFRMITDIAENIEGIFKERLSSRVRIRKDHKNVGVFYLVSPKRQDIVRLKIVHKASHYKRGPVDRRSDYSVSESAEYGEKFMIAVDILEDSRNEIPAGKRFYNPRVRDRLAEELEIRLGRKRQEY